MWIKEGGSGPRTCGSRVTVSWEEAITVSNWSPGSVGGVSPALTSLNPTNLHARSVSASSTLIRPRCLLENGNGHREQETRPCHRRHLQRQGDGQRQPNALENTVSAHHGELWTGYEFRALKGFEQTKLRREFKNNLFLFFSLFLVNYPISLALRGWCLPVFHIAASSEFILFPPLNLETSRELLCQHISCRTKKHERWL